MYLGVPSYCRVGPPVGGTRFFICPSEQIKMLKHCLYPSRKTDQHLEYKFQLTIKRVRDASVNPFAVSCKRLKRQPDGACLLRRHTKKLFLNTSIKKSSSENERGFLFFK